MDCSTPVFPVHPQLPELTQSHVHWVNDAIQPSHPRVVPFSCCLQSFPASGSFPISQFFLIPVFLVVLGLCCCVRVFSSHGKWAHSSLQCRGFLTWWLLLLSATGSRHVSFSSCQHAGSVVLAHGLSCSAACEIFLDQGLNSCSLCWQADSYTVYH